MLTKKRKAKIKKIIVPKNCPFCKSNTLPHFLETETLKNYISDRGKILGKDRTGLCAKHQRRITAEIKKARILSLLPFVVGL